MKNIEKQQITISGILKDTRETQKEINTASQVLGRSYTLADDMVFRAAKEKDDDPARKRSYKVVVDLHGKFAALCKCVEEEGQVQNTLRQLEAQVEAAAARGAALNVERVSEDLKQVKQENAGLSKLLA